MALKVACLTHPGKRRYRLVAEAMAVGVARCGDVPYLHSVSGPKMQLADVAVCYGWKKRAQYIGYPKFVYADLGFWRRDTHYRLVVGGWGPERYVRAGLPSSRLAKLGVDIKPWKEGGDTIIIAGSTGKSCAEHGIAYRSWEMRAAQLLRDSGKRIVYRPKPTDPFKAPLPGVEYDQLPIDESLSGACALVTHHSNAAVHALAAGIPIHCEVGAAAAFSVPMFDIANTPRLDGREQFLADVAWLNWSLDEMRAGEAWAHMKERGLLC